MLDQALDAEPRRTWVTVVEFCRCACHTLTFKAGISCRAVVGISEALCPIGGRTVNAFALALLANGSVLGTDCAIVTLLGQFRLALKSGCRTILALRAGSARGGCRAAVIVCTAFPDVSGVTDEHALLVTLTHHAGIIGRGCWKCGTLNS